MSNVNKKLDELLRQEWHKEFRLYSAILSLLVILLVSMVAYSTGETISVEARVKALHSQASQEFGEHFYIIVNLDSGKLIKLEIPREIQVRKGDKVILNKRKTNLFGLTSYSLQKVVRR